MPADLHKHLYYYALKQRLFILKVSNILRGDNIFKFLFHKEF